ncbi:MAG: AAA family ATPase [Gemmataceae bacterium]|nr:AAA family ATPase [Gemmataceae bacterium]
MHLEPLRGDDWLTTQAQTATVSWIWEGMVAEGNITLLTSVWKAGKSSLLGLLLAHRHQGGLLLDRLVETGASAVVSEEPPDLWRRRARNLGFGPNLSLFCRPFPKTPTCAEWEELIERLVAEHKDHGVNLVAFDPLIHVLPCRENNTADLRDALEALRRLTDLGIAVLILHHTAKHDAGLGKAARGAGALPAFADILLELRVPSGDASTHRRWLNGFSRYEETPRQLLAEMHVTGTSYRVLDDHDVSDDFSANWDAIAAALAAGGAPLTRQELLAHWPAARSVPHTGTLWRWLKRSLELGLVEMTGTGLKGEPFRFGLRTPAPQAG